MDFKVWVSQVSSFLYLRLTTIRKAIYCRFGIFKYTWYLLPCSSLLSLLINSEFAIDGPPGKFKKSFLINMTDSVLNYLDDLLSRFKTSLGLAVIEVDITVYFGLDELMMREIYFLWQTKKLCHRPYTIEDWKHPWKNPWKRFWKVLEGFGSIIF